MLIRVFNYFRWRFLSGVLLACILQNVAYIYLFYGNSMMQIDSIDYSLGTFFFWLFFPVMAESFMNAAWYKIALILISESIAMGFLFTWFIPYRIAKMANRLFGISE